MLRTKQLVLTCAGASLMATGVQAATFTQVNEPPGNELSHGELFSQFFFGDFEKNGNDYSNGVVDVTRVDDDMDQSYNLSSWTAEAFSSWAGASQSFGTAEDGILFDVQGSNGQQVSGSATDLDGGTDIHFARFGNELGTVDVTTDPASNSSGRDHVVTYTVAVDGVPQDNIYYLFFEDGTDNDFNDLVVRITTNDNTPNIVVPEPGSLALVALGGLVMLRRRR